MNVTKFLNAYLCINISVLSEVPDATWDKRLGGNIYCGTIMYHINCVLFVRYLMAYQPSWVM